MEELGGGRWAGGRIRSGRGVRQWQTPNPRPPPWLERPTRASSFCYTAGTDPSRSNAATCILPEVKEKTLPCLRRLGQQPGPIGYYSSNVSADVSPGAGAA